MLSTGGTVRLSPAGGSVWPLQLVSRRSHAIRQMKKTRRTLNKIPVLRVTPCG